MVKSCENESECAFEMKLSRSERAAALSNLRAAARSIGCGGCCRVPLGAADTETNAQNGMPKQRS